MPVRYTEKRLDITTVRETLQNKGFIREGLDRALVDGERVPVPIYVLYSEQFKRLGRVDDHTMLKLMDEKQLTQLVDANGELMNMWRKPEAV